MIYVVADIHGQKVWFDDILQQINFGEKDKLYILGDVIDRGPDGITLLQQIKDDPRMLMLLGNHEYMMLNSVKHPNDLDFLHLWYLNGGAPTHEAYNTLNDTEKDSLIRYLTHLPLNRRITLKGKKYLLVHGAPAEWYALGKTAYLSKKYFAVWTRIPIHQPIEEDVCIIFGHTPTTHYAGSKPKMQIWKRNDGKLIGMDCGCAYGGYPGQLGCLLIDDMQEFYSSKVPMHQDDIL